MNNPVPIKRSASNIYLIVSSILACLGSGAIFLIALYSYTLDVSKYLVLAFAVSSLLILLTIGLGAYQIISGKKITELMKIALWIPSFLIVPILAVIIVGLLQDISGVSCGGFFGSQSSCSESGLVSVIGLAQLIPTLIGAFGIYCGLVLSVEITQP